MAVQSVSRWRTLPEIAVALPILVNSFSINVFTNIFNANRVLVYHRWTAGNLNLLAFRQVPNNMVRVPPATGIIWWFSNTVPMGHRQHIYSEIPVWRSQSWNISMPNYLPVRCMRNCSYLEDSRCVSPSFESWRNSLPMLKQNKKVLNFVIWNGKKKPHSTNSFYNSMNQIWI